MGFKFPFSTLHELNLDWILEKVTTLWNQAEENNNKADYAVETADEAKQIAEQAAQAQIGDGAVTTAKLADSAVTSAKLANNAVYSANIVDGEVKGSDIADGAVTTAKITDSSVTQGKIMDGAVTSSKLASAAVTTVKIADKAVSANKIADHTITSQQVSQSTTAVDLFATLRSAFPSITNDGYVTYRANALGLELIDFQFKTSAAITSGYADFSGLIPSPSVSTNLHAALASSDGKTGWVQLSSDDKVYIRCEECSSAYISGQIIYF